MLTVFSRPTTNQMRLFKEMLNVTLVVTVQRADEFPEDVEELCQKYGLKHKFIRVDGASHELLSNKANQRHLKKEVFGLFDFLS